MGHPWQYKFENNDGYAGKEFSYINILDYGRLMFGTFREGASMCGTLNVCEAFVMTCRQADATKPTV